MTAPLTPETGAASRDEPQMPQPMARDAPDPSSRGQGRSMVVISAIAIGIGLVGFLVGITQPVAPQRSAIRPQAAQASSAVAAPAYRELATASVGPNRTWKSNFVTLKQARPDLFAPVIRTPAMKDLALRDRLRTRAFDGAPPVIPHAIEQQSSASCLVCHAEGLHLSGRIAPKISHPHYSSCTQCHVETGSLPSPASVSTTQNSPGGSFKAIASVNEFAGLPRSGPGQRAMSGSPPTIPHTTHLRGDCMSCHGLVARPGLRTTHPWLQNCIQCHAPVAEFDQASVAVSSEAVGAANPKGQIGDP